MTPTSVPEGYAHTAVNPAQPVGKSMRGKLIMSYVPSVLETFPLPTVIMWPDTLNAPRSATIQESVTGAISSGILQASCSHEDPLGW
jgi:hypothetical protein